MIEIYCGGMVKNGCAHSGLRMLKVALLQEGINGINWSLEFWQKFGKVKSYFNKFCILVVKNGPGLWGLGTLKSTVSEEWIDKMGLFFKCWNKFRKAKLI